MTQKKKGFVVLMAVIVTTIILTVGIGVLNLALREFILANVGRDSVKAFYAADTGLECGFNFDIISSETPLEPYYASPLTAGSNPGEGINTKTNIVCNGQSLNVTGLYQTGGRCKPSVGPETDCITTRLSRSIDPDETDIAKTALCLTNPANPGDSCVGACVSIEVRKIPLTSATQETQIIANGINDCQGDRKVERSLVLTWGAAD